MMGWLFVILSVVSLASPVERWENMLNIVEQHEFYKNNEVINHPKDSWEALMGITYIDKDLRLHKDCVFYKVPGDELGILKIKTTNLETSCDKLKLEKPDEEWREIKSFQFSINLQNMFFHLTFNKFKAQRWDIERLNSNIDRNSKIISLSTIQSHKGTKLKLLKDGSWCHSISDECIETQIYRCDECAQGWFEVPNGCKVGPKMCGHIKCGEKNAPACRRGMTYQGQSKKYDCRIDSSFAYCEDGLTVQCEGHLAYCR